MIIRSKAPLRLGLAGGGTDVPAYSDAFGGSVLNATIDMYAYATIRPLSGKTISLHAVDVDQHVTLKSQTKLPINGQLDLAKGVYNRVVKDYAKKSLAFELTTFVDAPPGSGLGSSSTLVVAMLGAFVEWLKLPLSEYDIAHLAYKIEREDLGMKGGKQDQYTATFGGVNYMEFYEQDRVIVNPLRIKDTWLQELGHNLILFSTKTSRVSSSIIAEQEGNIKKNDPASLEAMHSLKKESTRMKEALLTGRIDDIGKILDSGWKLKKATAAGVSNPLIERIYESAKRAGATGGKISGAGGGGFMVFYAPQNEKFAVIQALDEFGGHVVRYNFSHQGLTTWTT